MKSAHNLQIELTLAHGLTMRLLHDGHLDLEMKALISMISHAVDLFYSHSGFYFLSGRGGDEFYDRACFLREELTKTLDAASAVDCGGDLRQVLANACVSAGDLVREAAKAPSAMSCRLTELATRLLPLAVRLEYAELFQSELCDLAQSGTSRWAQIRHALRVLVRAPLLRHELRVPARERSW